MKIGVYGGSFNPVHNGHLKIMKKILSRKLVDKIWIVPCKSHAFDKQLAPVEDRIKMITLAIDRMKDVKIDYSEIDCPGKSYTSKTLRKFNSQYVHKFYFIAGADLLPTMHEWYDFEYIRKTPLIVVDREGSSQLRDDMTIDTVIDKLSIVSSTDIRERFANGESIKGLVPRVVEQYIIQNGVYKGSMDYDNPAATASLIVPMKEGILWVKRKHSPFKGYWALPGGYLETGKEDLSQAAARELFEETSLIARPEDMELLAVNSSPKRDPRGHVIDHVYVVKRFKGIPKANDDAAEIIILDSKPEYLAFDHSEVYEDYIKKYKG